MVVQFWIADNLAACQARLHQYTASNRNIQLTMVEDRDEAGALSFSMRRRDSQLWAVTPQLRGILARDQGLTRIEAEFYPTEPIVGLFFLFFLALVAFSGCGLSSRFVVEQRAATLGYGLVPNFFPFLLLVLPLENTAPENIWSL